MIKVAGLYRIGLQVPNLEETSRFYSDNWAMKLDSIEGDRHYFRSKGQDHSDLVVSRGDTAKLDHVGLSVRSAQELEQILGRIETAGHTVLQVPGESSRRDAALSAAVRDADGNRVELIVASPDSRAEGAFVRHIGHVVLWTPQIEQQEAFYALLGFRVSDRTHIGMSFLRCNADHHSLALARSGSGRSGLQHAAFDVGSIDDVMREYARLRQEGQDCIWGVGRHGPGNNVFAYYRDPAGNVVEFYGDMETVGESDVNEPRFWGPEHKGDIWGVAGAPPLPFRD